MYALDERIDEYEHANFFPGLGVRMAVCVVIQQAVIDLVQHFVRTAAPHARMVPSGREEVVRR
jgi:hypothetical protein